MRRTRQALPQVILLDAYPQLRALAWGVGGLKTLTPDEAFAMYERNWRHVDQHALMPRERKLLAALIAHVGRGHLLV